MSSFWFLNLFGQAFSFRFRSLILQNNREIRLLTNNKILLAENNSPKVNALIMPNADVNSSTSSPGPSPRSKWRSDFERGEGPGDEVGKRVIIIHLLATLCNLRFMLLIVSCW